MSSTKGSDRGVILDAVSWIFFAFALIMFCMRLCADVFILGSMRRDTWIASITFLVIITSQVFTTLSVYYGMGQHLQSLAPVQIMYSLKWSWMAQIFQLLANTTGKIAVISYLNHISGPSYAKARAFLWTLCWLQVASIIVLIAFILAQCSPLQKLWNEAIPGTCNGRIRNRNFAFGQGSLSASTDICLVLYPIMLFWNLQQRLLKKVMLSVLFAFGLLAAASSIVKTCNLQLIGNTTDITYDLAYLIIWNAADMYIVFIASSIPTLMPLFRKRASKLTKSAHHTGRNTGFYDEDGFKLTSRPMDLGRVNGHAAGVGDFDHAEENSIGTGGVRAGTTTDELGEVEGFMF